MYLIKVVILSLTTLFALLPVTGYSQNLNNTSIASSDFCDTIPFEYIRGKMIISVWVNQHVSKFIVDTGAPLLISDKLQSELNLEASQNGTVRDVTGQTGKIPVVSIPEINIGTIRFTDSKAMVFDKAHSGMLNCFGVDGLLGSTLLKHCIVHIDTKKQIIILTDKAQNIPLQNSAGIKMKLDANSRPFLKLGIGNRSEIEVLFDSGSDKMLPLSYKAFSRLAGKRLAQQKGKGRGSMSSGLFGAGKEGDEYRVLLTDVRLGSAIIDSVVTTASEHKNKNALGMSVCQYGTITIDYLHKKFYFNARQQRMAYQNPGFYGFAAQLIDNRYQVSLVYEGSQAERLGLRRGYHILKMNDLPLSDLSEICEAFLMKIPEGEPLQLTFADENENIRTIHIEKEY